MPILLKNETCACHAEKNRIIIKYLTVLISFLYYDRMILSLQYELIISNITVSKSSLCLPSQKSPGE